MHEWVMLKEICITMGRLMGKGAGSEGSGRQNYRGWVGVNWVGHFSYNKHF